MSSVILFGSASASLGGVGRNLERLGLAAHAAKSAREVIWLLEAGEREFAAIFIDGDCVLPDRSELLTHLAKAHPNVPRLLMLTSPSITESDGCIVVDKLALDERVRQLLP